MTKVGFKTFKDGKDLALMISLDVEGSSNDAKILLAATEKNTISQVRLVQESIQALPSFIKALVEAAEVGEKIEFSEETVNV